MDILRVQNGTIENEAGEKVEFIRYRAVSVSIENGKIKAASVRQWADAMLSSKFDRAIFLDVLRNKNPFRAFFFEVCAVTESDVNTKPFEFVIIDAPSLYKYNAHGVRADTDAFDDHFKRQVGLRACAF